MGHSSITLSNTEWERFLTFLNTPDEPNAVLRAAAQEYLKEFPQCLPMVSPVMTLIH